MGVFLMGWVLPTPDPRFDGWDGMGAWVHGIEGTQYHGGREEVLVLLEYRRRQVVHQVRPRELQTRARHYSAREKGGGRAVESGGKRYSVVHSFVVHCPIVTGAWCTALYEMRYEMRYEYAVRVCVYLDTVRRVGTLRTVRVL